MGSVEYWKNRALKYEALAAELDQQAEQATSMYFDLLRQMHGAQWLITIPELHDLLKDIIEPLTLEEFETRIKVIIPIKLRYDRRLRSVCELRRIIRTPEPLAFLSRQFQHKDGGTITRKALDKAKNNSIKQVPPGIQALITKYPL